jgi:hypothetical glycosyl hydrolase
MRADAADGNRLVLDGTRNGNQWSSEIHDVIGPDEYTEHVNNNAYTNYLAWHNVACARQFMAMFGREDARFTENATQFLARLWLPEADAEGVIPQDDPSWQNLPSI